MTDSGRSWHKVLRRAPRWVVALVFAVAWSGMILGMQLLKGRSVQAEDVAITGAFGLLLAAFVLWYGRRLRTKEGKLPPGSPTGTNITRAVSTGQLPEKATAEEWVPELNKLLRQERHAAWAWPPICCLVAAGGIYLVFDTPEHPWFGVFAIALALCLAIWYPLYAPRRRTRIHALLAQFPEDEEASLK